MSEVEISNSKSSDVSDVEDSPRTSSTNGVYLTWHDLSVTTKPKRLSLVKRLTSCCSKSSAQASSEVTEVTVTEAEATSEESPDYDNNKDVKVILKPTNGVIKPATLCAIMGSSGSGKTTFLTALAHQTNHSLVVNGNVKLNGVDLTKDVFKNYCGFVQQDDVLLPYLTVEDTLRFHANLKLPFSWSYKQKEQRVTETITKLGLEHCRKTIIGDANIRGISGGEKRRVSIATELIQNPKVLFLDEPTSGLDAKTSMVLTEILADLAHTYNHTVICTIHQPRSSIYQLFDELMLLCKGNTVYFGPATEATKQFEKWGYYSPKETNPADWLIDMITLDARTKQKEEDSKRRINDILMRSSQNLLQSINLDEESCDIVISQDQREYNLTGKLSKQTVARRNTLSKTESTKSITEHTNFENDFIIMKGKQKRNFAFFWEMFYLSERNFLSALGNKIMLFARFIQLALLAVLISILFFNVGDDQSYVQDRLSALFLCLLAGVFGEATASCTIFASERPVVNRERASGMYSASTYFFAKQVTEVGFQILLPLTFAVVVYWPVGFQVDFFKFAIFCLAVVAMSFVANSFGMLVGAAFPLQLCPLVITCTTLILMLLGGFYVHPDNLPVWLAWGQYVSFFSYGNNIMIVNEFKGLDFVCTSDQEINVTTTTDAFDANGMPKQYTQTQTICPITKGQQVIDDRDADVLEIWQNFAILFALILVFRILTYLAIRFLKPKTN